MRSRDRLLSALLLASLLSATPLSAQTDPSKRQNVISSLVLSASDRILNEMRFACAAGKAGAIEARLATKWDAGADVVDNCLAVLREAALKRPNTMHLYSDLQPGRAFDEWGQIIAAAGKDLSTYINVDGATKNLSCALALDAGYIYGARNLQQSIAPELADAAILKSASDCYAGNAHVSSRAALTVGARIAQLHSRAGGPVKP